MGKLLCIEGAGGIELHGYLEEGGDRMLLLHYHGLAGNFYENKFIHDLAKELPRHDIAFLTVNSRAHDRFSDAHMGGDSKVLRRGAAHTKLSEVRSDLETWINFASNYGFKTIVLQGHSAGAVSITSYLLSDAVNEKIKGIILASPTDMVGLQLTAHGKEGFEALLQLARTYVNEGHPRKMMPESALEGYSFDAETFLDLFQPDGDGDVFDFRIPNHLSQLRQIGRPILCFFGGGDEVCPVPVANALNSLRVELSPYLDVTTSVIEGACHAYRGFENVLTSLVLDWMTRLRE